MRTKLKPLLLLLIGAGLMGIFQSLTHCNKDDDFLKNSISSSELKPNIDYKALEKTINKIEDACKDNNIADLKELTFTEDPENPNVAAVNNYVAEELQEIGKALRKAKRNVVTENFAEYTYTINNVDFTFTMALDENGEWKLVRF